MKFPWDRIFDLDHWKFFGLLIFALVVFWLIPAEHRNNLISFLIGAGGGWVAGRTSGPQKV